MAKGSAMGLWKGKKGSSVFYKIWNTNNKEVQGIREYQPNVRNPQTDYQVDQRMKMLPAQLVKGALRNIVSRSFQGIPYGSKSRLEFLKYALRADVVPFLPKGWTDPVPGSYLISRGTLPPIGVTFAETIPGFLTNIAYDLQEFDTIGEFSAEILGKNPQFMPGDQLTFVVCNYWTEYLVKFGWAYFSVILDESNTDPIDTIRGMRQFVIGTEGQHLYISGEADNACAAGIIHSRLGSDGLYLRSNCELVLAESGWNDEFDSYFTAAAAGIARRSYQKQTTTRLEDWPVQESDESGVGSVIDGTYTLTGLTGDTASLNGRPVKVRIRESSGTIVAVYYIEASGSPVLCSPGGDWLEYLVSGEVRYLTQAQVPALAGLPAVPYTANGRTLSAGPSAEEEEKETRKIAKKSAKKSD